MNLAPDLPLWTAVLVGVSSLIGALLTLLGCLGLVRFEDFYARLHAPTLGTSFGTIFIAAASMIYFSVSGQRPAVHEAVIVVFILITTPITLMLLARAALYRDHGGRDVAPGGTAEDGKRDDKT